MIKKLNLPKVIIIYLIVLAIVISCFSLLYTNTKSLNEEGNFYENLYFSTVTYMTVGYGDIYPSKNIGKILISIEGIVGIVINSIFAGLIFMMFIKTKKRLMLPDNFAFKYKKRKKRVCIRIGNKKSELSDVKATLEVFRFEDDRRIKVGQHEKSWPYIDKVVYFDVDFNKLDKKIENFLYEIMNSSVDYNLRLTVQAVDVYSNDLHYISKTYSGNNFYYIEEYQKIYTWKNGKRSKVNWNKFEDIKLLEDSLIKKMKDKNKIEILT